MRSIDYSGKEGVIYHSLVGEVSLVWKEKKTSKRKITGSNQAASFFREIWEDDLLIRESMYIMFLNRVNNINAWSLISKGGIVGTVIDNSLIIKLALETLSRAVIICHNHPSGTNVPSQTDQNITVKIKDGLQIMDIQLLDHIILTNESYYSFSDEGLL
jgi:DNA repair protein RadC